MMLSNQKNRVIHWIGRAAPMTAFCLAASLVVASTGNRVTTVETNAVEVLAIQSLVAHILDPATPSPAPSSTVPYSVLDVQRLLSGLSDSEEGQPSSVAPDWWALSPAPLRGTSIEAAPVARLIEVPRSEDEGFRQRVQPFPPPPLSRVLERYRMMLTPHAPPQFSQLGINRII